eukprot:4962423-Pyramimonas_sp.AAC.1
MHNSPESSSTSALPVDNGRVPEQSRTKIGPSSSCLHCSAIILSEADDHQQGVGDSAIARARMHREKDLGSRPDRPAIVR